MKRVLIVVLAIVVVVLGWFLYKSIMDPIKFDREKERRYAATIKRLKDIRTAQVAYRSENNKYVKSFDSLINFIKTDSFRVVRQVGSFDDSAAVAEGRVYRDTILVSVKDSLFRSNVDIDSLRYVPYTSGAEFSLDAGELQTASKVVVQVFEAKVTNRVLLKGLNHQYIVNLDDVAKQTNRFPGLRVGSMTEATNNAGNWE